MINTILLPLSLSLSNGAAPSSSPEEVATVAICGDETVDLCAPDERAFCEMNNYGNGWETYDCCAYALGTKWCVVVTCAGSVCCPDSEYVDGYCGS